MAEVPCAPARSWHVPRCQTTTALLLERYHGRNDIQNLCRYGSNIFCKVCGPSSSETSQIEWTLRLVNSILPALAFILDMNRRTGGFYGMNEALFSSALACIVFSTIGAQPLTIVGITGLISLFNYTIFDIIKRYDVALYPQFMTWVAIWAAIFHWLFAIWNFCDYMRYVTDFSSQSFGAYVGIIYCSRYRFLFLPTT